MLPKTKISDVRLSAHPSSYLAPPTWHPLPGALPLGPLPHTLIPRPTRPLGSQRIPLLLPLRPSSTLPQLRRRRLHPRLVLEVRGPERGADGVGEGEEDPGDGDEFEEDGEDAEAVAGGESVLVCGCAVKELLEWVVRAGTAGEEVVVQAKSARLAWSSLCGYAYARMRPEERPSRHGSHSPFSGARARGRRSPRRQRLSSPDR